MSSSFPAALSEQEELHYLSLLAEGDNDAKNILIEHNLRLVAHIVKKYANTGFGTDDLISIGTIGLIKSINTYNGKRSVRLATYAARCIENEILMHLRTSKKNRAEISLEEPLGTDKDGNEISFIDILGTDPDAILEDISHKLQVKMLYSAILNALNERERMVIINRYGIGCEPLPQREVARRLGISRSYVSRIEKRAVEKLRHFIPM